MVNHEMESRVGKIILYHGSSNENILPQFGQGNEKHDYGKGFYLTESLELAREWAVYRPDALNGWVHQYELDIDELNILDFRNYGVLTWLAELMKHRAAADSKRYRMLSGQFIDKFAVSTEGYDVIKGWRANASYFYIAKAFVRDEVDIDILEELLALGDLGIQYCIKTQKAYKKLSECHDALQPVEFAQYNEKYNRRDVEARENMRRLIDSDRNHVTKVFSTLL